MALYEILRDNIVLEHSLLLNCDHPPELLRQMEKDGYTIRIDGRPRRKREPRQSEKEA